MKGAPRSRIIAKAIAARQKKLEWIAFCEKCEAMGNRLSSVNPRRQKIRDRKAGV